MKFIKNIVDSLITFWLNHIITHIPCKPFRKMNYNLARMKIGAKTQIDMNQYILAPYKLKIGNGCHINQGCFIDARGGVQLNSNVSVSHYVKIVSGSHDVQSKSFDGKFKPIIIDDFVWLGIGSTILQGVKIGKGAVVCAGAIVTKDVLPYEIVAGIPAKKIGERNKKLDYKCNPQELFR